MNIEEMMNLSDEDFAALGDTPPAPEPAAEQQEQQEQQQEQTPTPNAEGEGEVQKPEGEGDDARGAAEGEEAESTDGAELSDEDALKQPGTTKPKAPEPKAEGEGAAAPEPKKETPPAEKPKEGEAAAEKTGEEAPVEDKTDYKAEFGKLVGVPIKANGREITLKSADEALRLIQQGAGYAQKMEQLKPARKSAAMLEAAGLLGNEAALGQMIDLYKGDTKAIARLVKDLNIDIFSLDKDSGDNYTPNSHLQTDAAVNFSDTLKEIRTLDGGKEAMALIDAMDQQSKDLIWGNAEAIRQIYEYKQTGVYDTVATELERRRLLGEIPADIPYIVAFQRVGEDVAKASDAEAARQAALRERNPPVAEPAKPAPRTPISTGPAPKKPEAPNAPAAAAAAAAPRTGAGAAKQVHDIYNLSDADIEKMQSFPG